MIWGAHPYFWKHRYWLDLHVVLALIFVVQLDGLLDFCLYTPSPPPQMDSIPSHEIQIGEEWGLHQGQFINPLLEALMYIPYLNQLSVLGVHFVCLFWSETKISRVPWVRRSNPRIDKSSWSGPCSNFWKNNLQPAAWWSTSFLPKRRWGLLDQA